MSEVVDALTERMAAAQAELRERGQTARHARMRAAVLERTVEAPARPRAWAWSVAAGAVAAAVLLMWIAVRPGPLTYQLQGGSDASLAQAFVAAGDDQPLTVEFSDGSAVTLQPRTRVRVGALRDDGADLVLESGSLQASIEPRPGGSWTVAAGPYLVNVVGTIFTVHWEPEGKTFALELERGAVRVQGPGIDGVRQVAAGERVTVAGGGESAGASEGEARARDAAVEVDEELVIEDREHDEPGEPTEPRAGVRRKHGGKASRSGSGGSAEAAAGWRELAQQGSYREAIAAAEAAGFSQLCASLDAAALLELADAGRYARKPARAREALLALRRRFSGTEAAAAAAFDLGRLASGGGRGCDDARSWFQTYLRERPKGSMADAARKRIDECGQGSAEEAGSEP